MKKEIYLVLLTTMIVGCHHKNIVKNTNITSQKQPNVLLIMVDDLKPTLGVYGDKFVKSPNIDALAKSGIRFDKAYANQAVCGPSRYNLLFGSRSTSTGLYSFGKEFRYIYPSATSMPEYFKNAGYHTEAIGKVFHVGHGNTDDLQSWSIPHHKEKVIEYIFPQSTGGKLTREEAFFENTRMHIADTPANKEMPRGAAWEEADVVDDAYADGRVAKHAIDRLRVLKNKSDQPFFMALGFARPHLPFSVPKKYWDMYDPKGLPQPTYEQKPLNAPEFVIKKGIEIDQFEPIPEKWGIYPDSIKRKLIHGYYASVSYMDAQLGKVVDELKRLNLDKNTIIVLWGDHGWHLGDHGMWTKHTNFEQATRIPIIMVAPGYSKPNTSSNQIVESVDLFPTLVSLAGLNAPEKNVVQPIDGIDLSPIFKDATQIIKTHAYHSYIMGGYLGEAIRNDRYRMVRWSKLSDRGDKIYELYDYQSDYLETENIAGRNRDIVEQMESTLKKYPQALNPN